MSVLRLVQPRPSKFERKSYKSNDKLEYELKAESQYVGGQPPATGHARTDSDWDVAILYSGEPPRDLQFSSGLRNRDVDIGIFPSDQVWRERESHVAGTLAHELRNNGIELVGEMPKENNNDIVISEEELARHL